MPGRRAKGQRAKWQMGKGPNRKWQMGKWPNEERSTAIQSGGITWAHGRARNLSKGHDAAVALQ